MAHAAQLAVLLFLQSAPGAQGACPAPEAIKAALLPSTAKLLRGNGEHVVLSTSDTRLRVELADESGASLLERTLPTSAPCAARAAAAATLIEAMELELHGGAPSVDLPAVAAESHATATSEAATPPQKSVDVEVGVAFLGALSQATIEPAAGLTVDVFPRLVGLRLRAGLFAEGRRSLSIGGGSATYQTSWLAIGPGYRLRWGRFFIEAGLSLTASLQELRGDGVTSLTSTSTIEAGASLDAAAGWSFGSWRIWGGFFALYWPENTKIAVAALGASRTLPSWEGLLGAGAQFKAL